MATVVGTAELARSPTRPPEASPRQRVRSDVRTVAPALVIGAAIVAGMALNLAPLTGMAALAAMLLALVSPAAGLAIIAFMGPLQPPLVIPAPGFNALLVGAAVMGCIYRLPIDRPRLVVSAPFLLLAAFVLYVGVQQTPEMVAGYSGSTGYLSYSIFRELLTGFGTVLVAAYVLPRMSPYPILAILLGSAVFAAVLAILTLSSPIVGPPIAGLMTHTSDANRGIGPFGNPNYFGVFEATAMVTAIGLSFGTRSARLRSMLLAACVVIAIGTALSLSRGAVVAFAAGLGCLAFSRGRTREAVVIAVLLATGVALYPAFVEWRLTITDGPNLADAYAVLAQSDRGRLGALLAGPQLFLESPIFGIGWGHYSAMSAQFVGPGNGLVAHNWYVSVLAEQGAVGIILTALLLVTLLRALRSRASFPRSIGFAVLGAYAVGGLFLEAPTSFQTSVLAIIVIVAALVSDWSTRGGKAHPPIAPTST